MFKGRDPEIILLQAEPLSYARPMATNPETITKYFDLLEETLGVNGLAKKPGQIFNCDETGLPLQHATQRHPYANTSREKAQMTILACASASRYFVPPMVVFI